MSRINYFRQVSAAILLSVATIAASSEYPFTFNQAVTAKMTINSNETEEFNNQLLGTNIFKFSSQTEQDLINTFDPLTIRFPHGLWANWYDWHTDTTRVFGTDEFQYKHADGTTKNKKIDHLASLKIFESNGTKVGIEGLTELNENRKLTIGSGYDMVWTFNMSADGSDFDNGSPESVARYLDLLERGFEVKDIELGNENFYPGQRSSIIPNTEDYIKRAKSISKALKRLNPNLNLSVPLLRRENWANPNWNQDLTKDDSYFDAVTVHTYVGSDPDDQTRSDEAYGTALLARHYLAKSVDDYAKKVAPDKPIWLTEWGVKSGGANAASILGMADAYIFMSQHQDTYHRANWFSVNGKLNSFLVWETYISPSGVERPRIKYPLEKTAFGATHEIIREVLQDAVMLDSYITTSELNNGVEAVSGRAVTKGHNVELLVVNLSDQTVPFTIEYDGQLYNGRVTHTAMAFNSIDEEKVMAINAEPLKPVSYGSDILLPPLSLNKIILNEQTLSPERFAITLATATRTYQFKQRDLITIDAFATTNIDAISSVTFYHNGIALGTDESEPFQLNWQPELSGTQAITAVATRNDGKQLTSEPLLVNVEPISISFTVSLAAIEKTEIDLGESLMLQANVDLNYGKTEYVEFRVNGQVVHQSTSEPYQYHWQPNSVGQFSIDVIATNSFNQSKSSQSVLINVEEVKEVVTPAKEVVDETQESASGGTIGLFGLGIGFLLVFNRLTARRK